MILNEIFINMNEEVEHFKGLTYKMTSATKSLNMLKIDCQDNIIPSCTTKYKSFDFLCFININKTFLIKTKITENKGGIHRKAHVSSLLIDLVSYK